MSNASRDQNFVPTLLGVSSADGVTPIPIYADPVTHRLLVDFSGAGGGNVTGPLSSTDSAIALFDGTTGEIIKNSVVTIDTNGAITVAGNYTLPYVDGTTGQTLQTDGAGNVTWSSVGNGDVSGPTSSTDNAIARFDLTTGKVIQNSTVTVADTTGIIAGTQGVTFSGSTSGTIALVPTAIAGSNTITLPAATGTVALTTGGSLDLKVGTTTVSNGTNGYVLYDNAGTLGEIQKATTATASTLVQRDSNINVLANNILTNATLTTSAGGTTVLTVASSRYQGLTGSSNQTYQLPDATTLSIGPWFTFNNNSSGSLTVTNAGGSTIYTIPAGGIAQIGPTSIATSNGTWDVHAFIPSTVTWGTGVSGLIFNTALSTTPQIMASASSATAPSFIPQRTASTTGFGGDGTNLFGTIGGTAYLKLASGILSPNASDATALGSGTLMWSDLFLANGGVVNWNNGNVVLTHTSGILTLGTGTLKITTPTDTSTSVVTTDGTQTLTNKSIVASQITTGTFGTGAYTMDTELTVPQIINTSNAITASGNAATVPITSRISTVTNNSAATLTITITTTSAVDGQLVQVRVLDFSAVAQTITWVNTENGEATAPTTSNGSTTLPRAALFQFNSRTSLWRCIAS